MYGQCGELIMFSMLLLVLALNSNHESACNLVTKENSSPCKNNDEKKDSKESKNKHLQLEDIF